MKRDSRAPLNSPEIDDDGGESDRLTASLAGLALALSLTVIGLFLTEKLASSARLGECLLQGRTNCDVIGIAVLR